MTKFGTSGQYTMDSISILLGNEVDRRTICLETRLLWQHTIDQPCFQARPLSCLFTSEFKKWHSQLSEDEVAEFLTTTEGKNQEYTQNILLDGCYLLFEENDKTK